MRFLSSLLLIVLAFLLLSGFSVSCQRGGRPSLSAGSGSSEPSIAPAEMRYWFARNRYYSAKDRFWSAIHAKPHSPLGIRVCMEQREVQTGRALAEAAQKYVKAAAEASGDRESAIAIKDRTTMPINAFIFWVDKYRKSGAPFAAGKEFENECESIRLAARLIQRNLDRFAPEIEAKLSTKRYARSFLSSPDYSSAAFRDAQKDERDDDAGRNEADIDSAELNQPEMTQRSGSVQVNVDIDA